MQSGSGFPTFGQRRQKLDADRAATLLHSAPTSRDHADATIGVGGILRDPLLAFEGDHNDLSRSAAIQHRPAWGLGFLGELRAPGASGGARAQILPHSGRQGVPADGF